VVDLFDEVEEQLRSERYKTLALKIAPYAVIGVIAAVVLTGGFWGWSHYRSSSEAKESQTYATALAARDANDLAGAQSGFEAASKAGPKAYRALALMQLGGMALEKNDAKGAAALFDQAADLGADPIISDAARLKSAFALLDTAPYADMERKLTPLAADGRPYRILAKEGLAFAKVTANNMSGARSDFVALSLLTDTPTDIRERAERMIALIDGGTAKSIPAVAKAAIDMSILPPAAPSGLPAGLVEQAPGAAQ
jgi:hypothetical protein